jgi:phosphatidylinositol 4-kinase
MAINYNSGGGYLDAVPEPEGHFVAMEVSGPQSSSRALQALDRLFAYVSAARLSHSPQRRWDAIHAAVQMLWDESGMGRSVTGAQLDQLFGLDPIALQSVLPQLLYYVLTHSGPVSREVKAFLLRTCAAAPSFGLELYWLLLAQPRHTAAASAADETVRLSLIEQMKQSVSRLLEVCAAPQPQPIGASDPDNDGATAVSQFRRELHLVQTLTGISEQLRAVERPFRLEQLRAALIAVNKLLPRTGGPLPPSWRPFVPLSGLDANPHAIARFLEDESFVLSTKERVPYLVFAEVVDAHPALLGQQSQSSAALAMRVRLGKLSRAVANRASNFRRRQQRLTSEGMPASLRRQRAESCAVHSAEGGTEPSSVGSPRCAAAMAGLASAPSMRLRSSSDPEEGTSRRIGGSFTGLSRAVAVADTELVIEGDPATLMPTPRLAAAPPSPENEPDEPEREARAHKSRLLLQEAASASEGDALRPDGGGTLRGTRGARAADDEEDFDYSVNEGFGELWQERADRMRATSPYANLPGWALHAFIVKSNDELLQEQFAVSLIREFDRIFRHCRLPLRLRPYRILATSPTTGLIEVVPNAKSLDSVKKSTANYYSLADFFRRRYGGASSVSFHRARRNFVQSLAAYSVVSYLLQLKDRHNGNILLHANGSVIHIDFGFLLSNSPGKNMGFEAAPFKLTGEWVELMGGIGSPWFRYYRTLVVRGFQEARRHRDKVLLIVHAAYRGVGGSFPCFRAGESTVEAMRQRFQPDMTQQQYARYAANLIDNALDNWTTGAYDCYQRCCLGIL